MSVFYWLNENHFDSSRMWRCHKFKIQGVHKTMVWFQKLTRNLFLTLLGHNVHRQQRQLSKFIMRYQQFASHAYCGTSFRDGVAAGKGFLCAPFWGVQLCDYSAACSAVHCNHRSGHLKTEHTESLFLLRRHLGNWPRGAAVSMRNELLVAHEKLGELPLLTVYVVPL